MLAKILAMILRAGFQSFEVQRSFELPKPIVFQSRDGALNWLKRHVFLNPQNIPNLRQYIGRFFVDPEYFRMTDQQVLEKMADLLYSHKAVVVAREERSGGGTPTPKTSIPAAFPLSERASRSASESSPKPATAEDPPTFDSRVDAVAQAAMLVAAANESMPFCPE